jgi:hypothetical protein
MTPIFMKRAAALAIVLGVSVGTPGFAQDAAAPGAPTPDVQPASPRSADETFRAKGPLSFYIHDFGPKGQRKNLALVPRSLVAGANTGAVIGGVARVLMGVGGGTISGAGKEDFYGIQNNDVKDSERLTNPLLRDIPAAIDQQILAMVADDPELSAMKFKDSLHIGAGAWILVYDELLSDSDNYYMLFKASFSKQWEGDKRTFTHQVGYNGASCGYKSELKPLSVWRANDYEAVVIEKKLAADACVKSVTAELPRILGLDSDSKIRTAKLTCKTTYAACVAASASAADPDASKKLCKVEQKQCVSEEVKPLVDMTPLGQCKVTLLDCRASATEKFHETSPEGKPGKAEFLGCTTEYKKCAEANKKPGLFQSIF